MNNQKNAVKEQLGGLRHIVFLNRIYEQVFEEQRNFNIVIIGKPGTGKSYCNLRLFEMIDPNFDQNRITFSPDQFLEIVNARPPPGSCAMLEEAGTSIARRTWYSQENLVMGSVMQTFRIQQLISSFTLPDTKFLDNNVLAMCDALIETINVDFRKKKCRVKVKMIERNIHRDKTYTPFLTRHEGRRYVEYPYLDFCKPNKDLVKQYEYKKFLFNKELHSKSLAKLKKTVIDEYGRPTLTKLQQEVHGRLLAGWNKRQVCDDVGLGYSKLKKLIDEIEECGYDVKPETKKEAGYGYKMRVIDPGRQ